MKIEALLDVVTAGGLIDVHKKTKD